MSTQKRKRQTISIEIKKQIIDAKAADSSKSYAELAKDFSKGGLTLTKGNVQVILKHQVQTLKKRLWKAMKKLPKPLNKSQLKEPRRAKHSINFDAISAKTT